MRVGIGTDVHAFDSEAVLWLGCIQWPGEPGLAGHSDGDVAAHAVCDALFSAASLGDMGSNFGTAHPEFAGAAGAVFLQRAAALVAEAGYSIEHVAVQVIGNAPKVSTRREEMQTEMSKALAGASVSVSATTTDALGFTGRGEGLAAIATCLLVASK